MTVNLIIVKKNLVKRENRELVAGCEFGKSDIEKCYFELPRKREGDQWKRF